MCFVFLKITLSLNISATFSFSIQRTYFKTLMQEVEEKELAHQDPSDLVRSRQPSTTSRSSERLALLKNMFVRTRSPKPIDTMDRPYRN